MTTNPLLEHSNSSHHAFGKLPIIGPVIAHQAKWLEQRGYQPSTVDYHLRALRQQEAARKLGLTNLVKHAQNAHVSTEVLIDTFRGAVAYQQAKAIWESDDELRYFQSNEHERLRLKFQEDDEKQLKTNRRFIRTSVGNGDVTEGWKGRTAGDLNL